MHMRAIIYVAPNSAKASFSEDSSEVRDPTDERESSKVGTPRSGALPPLPKTRRLWPRTREVKPNPNDVDIFIVMDDDFDFSSTSSETHLLFEHGVAQSHFGASVFWLRQLGAYNGEDAAIADWKIKRDGTERGIVEIRTDQSHD